MENTTGWPRVPWFECGLSLVTATQPLVPPTRTPSAKIPTVVCTRHKHTN